MSFPSSISTRPFTYPQASQAGISRRTLERLVHEGQVVRVLRGVYRSVSLHDDLEMRCVAVSLVMRPFGVICDRTAAWLYDVDLFSVSELNELPPLDTFVLRGHSRTRRVQCRGGSRDLVPQDVRRVFGVWVTTPLRTALDLGCSLGPRDALACLDGFMRLENVPRESMQAELPRFRGRRGVVQLRRLIMLATADAESPGESWTRMAIIEAGLPVPEAQVWVMDEAGVPRFRLDLAYAWAKIAIEYDGQEFHSDPESLRRDELRREWLRQRGWTVIVVDRESFSFDAWQSWTNELATALRRAQQRAS